MSFEDNDNSASDHDFGDLFGSEDEASDIDDGRSQSSIEQQNSPAPRPAKQSNDLDNLFGSDDESASGDEPEKRQTLKQRRARTPQSSEDERDSGRRSPARDDDDVEDEDDDQYGSHTNKKQRVEVSLEMPQLPVPYSDNNKYYLAKLPRFLDIEVNPFVPEEFQVQIEEGLSEVQVQESIREQIENTIRWRKVLENGYETMQSNAHLVEWEDGKVSMMLGDECFDVGSKPVGNQEHAYLLAHQTGSGALESQTEFTDHMTFRPSGLKSDTHRHLTAQIADQQVKKNRTKMFFTEKDPELMKQELESQENERLKAQKKLELQRRKADMRYGDMGSRRNNEFSDYNDVADYSSSHGASGRGAQDRYEDDFVVDDDEYDEEEERSRENRLSQAKSSGMDRYKRSRYNEDEDEDEEDEDEDYGIDDDEDEEVVVRRHKRNHISSDEE
ncbi:Leo1-like protein-domain-containing protein [Parasitella parasitica]|nr:Leo1-like protein-domain-containing protein [Parasitella parasitica]